MEERSLEMTEVPRGGGRWWRQQIFWTTDRTCSTSVGACVCGL